MKIETDYENGYKVGMAWGYSLTEEEMQQLIQKTEDVLEGKVSGSELAPPQHIKEMAKEGVSEAWHKGFLEGFKEGFVARHTSPKVNQ